MSALVDFCREARATRSELVAGIVAAACQEYGITREEYDTRKRYRPLIQARRMVWAKLRELGWSLGEIARATGYDHTTVLVGLRKAKSETLEQFEARMGWPKEPEGAL